MSSVCTTEVAFSVGYVDGPLVNSESKLTKADIDILTGALLFPKTWIFLFSLLYINKFVPVKSNYNNKNNETI